MECSNNNNNLPTYRESKLGEWIVYQRRNYRDNNLNDEQIKLLEKIDKWEWITSNTRQNYESNWYEKLNELKEYIKKYSELPPKTSNLTISNWVATQRRYYREGKLDENKIRILNEITLWEWDYQDQLNVVWLAKFNQFKEFLEKENRMPKAREGEIGRWVSVQKQTYIKNKLSQQRIDFLESLEGWQWKVK